MFWFSVHFKVQKYKTGYQYYIGKISIKVQIPKLANIS